MRRILAIIIAAATVSYGTIMNPFLLIAALAIVAGGLVIIIHFEINGGQDWLNDLWSHFKHVLARLFPDHRSIRGRSSSAASEQHRGVISAIREEIRLKSR